MRLTNKRAALAAVMVVPLALSLAACGGSNGEESGGAASGGGGNSSGGEELTVWTWDPAFNIYAMQEAEKVYQKDHPDFKLNIEEVPWDDIQVKINTLGQSQQADQMPDIFLVQNNAFQKNVTNYPDLFQTFDTSVIDYSEFPDSVVDYSVVDGQNWGLPFDSGAGFGAYRIDLLEEAGLKTSDFENITWDDFLEKGKIVLEKTGKPLLSGQAGSPDAIMMMLQSAGASLFDAEGNPTIADNDALLKSAEIYGKMVEAGVFREANNWDEYIGTIVNGEVAGVVNAVWIVGSMKQAADQSGKWEITTMPKVDGIPGATNYSANGGSSWAMSPAGNVELAQDFLKSTFAGSTEFYDTILPESGAVANWIPAGESEVYKEPQEFFNGQPIYEMVVEYSSSVPSNNTGVYYYEARDAIGVALTQIVGGAKPADAFKEAQETVEFAMQ